MVEAVKDKDTTVTEVPSLQQDEQDEQDEEPTISEEPNLQHEIMTDITTRASDMLESAKRAVGDVVSGVTAKASDAFESAKQAVAEVPLTSESLLDAANQMAQLTIKNASEAVQEIKQESDLKLGIASFLRPPPLICLPTIILILLQNSLWMWLPIYRGLLIGLATSCYTRLHAKHTLLAPRDNLMLLVVSFLALPSSLLFFRY